MHLISFELGKLRLLMVKGPHRSILDSYLIEKEFYSSDDDKLLGVVVLDKTDNNYSIAFLKRNNLNQFKLIDQTFDIATIEEARTKINEFEKKHVKTIVEKSENETCDLFSRIVVRPKQLHPYFSLLRENDFYSPAKQVIEEILYYFNDLDNNFVEQFQSINGFDSRIWELYLRAWFREDGFNIINKIAVPDFLLEKSDSRVAVEAVTIQRRQKDFGNMPPSYTMDEMQEKLNNETPLMFGSSLYSKLKHTYNNTNYWDLPETKGLPFCIAIADFQEDMSMTWSFPAIVSILYGVEQTVRFENGKKVLYTVNGNTFIKDTNDKKVQIIPLFLDPAFENISAIIFSATGTLSKFNRIGRMCGLGAPNFTMIAFKTIYNHDNNSTVCDSTIENVDENYNELWSEGINIFHNPNAKNPLDPELFQNVAHHFYKDGQIYSHMPNVAPFSILTWNFKGININISPLQVKFNNRFDDVARQWNQHQ